MANTDLIRIKMIENGFTVNGLAKKLRMEPYNCSKMIRGRVPFFRYRERAAKVLGVPVESIFPDGGRRTS